MQMTLDRIEVAIERRDNQRHVARINGEVIAKLSPYHRAGYGGRVTSWRIVDANNRVQVTDLRGTDAQLIEWLTDHARYAWNERKPEVIEAKARRSRELEIEQARLHVEYCERKLAEAKAHLEKLTNDGPS